MPRFRLYTDTSVMGGCFDHEFVEASQALMARVRQGDLTLVISELLIEELEQAPEAVQALLTRLPTDQIESILISNESEKLRDAYLAAKVVGPASSYDAHHVALASIAKVDYIVSWNFKHLVHIEKIRGFNSVNLRLGYSLIDIRTPKEVG
jgi:predicted nucleic acid-binding protein